MMRVKTILFFQLILFSLLWSQNVPVVYVYPFKSVDQNETPFSQQVYSYFCSNLSATGRVNLFSEKAWQKIFSTYHFILTINDFRDSRKVIKLGELTPVDYIVIGQINQHEREYYLHVEWINVHNGLIEKTFIQNIKDSRHFQEPLNALKKELLRFIVKEGKVLAPPSRNTIKIKIPEMSGWLLGDEFVLVNNLNYGYGRVRLVSFAENDARAEIIYLNDRIRVGDRVVLAQNFQNLTIPLRAAYLPPFKGASENEKELFLKTRQMIIESAKFYLIERPINQPYYEFNFSLQKKYDGRLFLVNLSITELPAYKIVFEKNIECVSADLQDALKILLTEALNRWEKKALVSHVSDTSIVINKGRNHKILKGQKILFRSEEDGGIIAESVVKQVSQNESRIEMPANFTSIRAGMMVTFVEPAFTKNQLHNRLQTIKLAVQQEKKRYEIERQEKLEVEKKIKAKKRLQAIPKSRVRFGYTLSLAKSKSDDQIFDLKNSPKMDIDLYLGSYPYLGLVLNYAYHHLQYKTSEDKIFVNFIGTGVRLQSPVFGPFSLYGIALYQYAFFRNPRGEDSPFNSSVEWKSQYLTLRTGLDLLINSGFGFYIEAGEQRTLKYEKIKIQFYSASAGISLWF
ncbi:hypothetical protein [Caldithrix abyssi]